MAPGGSSTATTVSGGTAYYGLMISGAPGVTGTVQLGCIPSSVLITCKVIPGSVTLNGGVDGGGVCDPDVLPGGDDGDGIRAARGRDWRRDWVAAGFDGVGWSDVDVPAEPAGGIDVCDFVVGGVGIGGMQQ